MELIWNFKLLILFSSENFLRTVMGRNISSSYFCLSLLLCAFVMILFLLVTSSALSLLFIYPAVLVGSQQTRPQFQALCSIFFNIDKRNLHLYCIYKLSFYKVKSQNCRVLICVLYFISMCLYTYPCGYPCWGHREYRVIDLSPIENNFQNELWFLSS